MTILFMCVIVPKCFNLPSSVCLRVKYLITKR